MKYEVGWRAGTGGAVGGGVGGELGCAMSNEGGHWVMAPVGGLAGWAVGAGVVWGLQ